MCDQQDVEDASSCAHEQADREVLTRLVMRERNPVLRDILHAQLRFRHEILPVIRHDSCFLDHFFQKPADVSWPAWYLVCFRRLVGPIEISSTTAHYLQRWVRQIYDPHGAVRAVSVGEIGGFGLWNFGPAVHVPSGRRLFGYALDGLVVPSTAVPPSDVSRLFSSYHLTTGELFPLVGPVSLLNGSAGSSFVFRTVTARDETQAFAEDCRKNPDDRFWHLPETLGTIKCVVVVASLDKEGGSVQGEDRQIFAAYE